MYQVRNYAEAAQVYERVIAINEQALGKDHPVVAMNLNNMALALREGGDSVRPLPLYERALQITEAAYGQTHPMWRSV